MADLKITELPAATTPLAGTELLEIVQGGVNKKVATSEVGGAGAVDSVNGQTGVVVLDAGDIPFTPAGNIAATDVQAAIQELDAEKSDILVSFRTLTASHTLDATDLASVNAGDVLKLRMNVATANNLTVPLNATQAFPVGTSLIVHQIGAGQTSIVATGGVTINSANGWVKIAYQYASVVLTKTGTDIWDLEGTLTA